MLCTMSSTDNDDTSHYEGALLEDIRDSVQRLTEAMAEIPGDVRQLKEDVGQLRQDVAVIKAVVTDQSSDLRGLDTRATVLEKAAV